MPETSRSDTSGHATLAATPARQGRFGKHMFWVLVFGTLLAAIGLFAAWTWKAPALSRASEQQSAAQAVSAPTYNAPEPGPATVQKSPDQSAP